MFSDKSDISLVFYSFLATQANYLVVNDSSNYIKSSVNIGENRN